MSARRASVSRMTRALLVLALIAGALGLAPGVARAQQPTSPSAQGVPTQGSPTQGASPAAKSPFGIAPPAAQKATPPGKPAADAGIFDRLSNWVFEKQAEYNRGLVQAVRRFKTDNVFAATLTLAFLSFVYGVFHAVGPGHGKAIISSYVLANAQTARRGVLIAFISSAFQAFSAIAIVGVMAIIFRATSVQMQSAEAAIERVSYALVTIVGAYLLYTQLRALLTGKPAHAQPHGHAHAHAHGAHHHAEGEHCDHCDHAHLPGPEQLKGEWSWSRALALSFAVGIRPCTGAILVLIFAMTQGLLWAGVFATLAMALGTAITVSLLAVLAVVSRDWAARLGDGRGGILTRVHQLAGLLGSALVFLLGFLLLWGSFGPARPF